MDEVDDVSEFFRRFRLEAKRKHCNNYNFSLDLTYRILKFVVDSFGLDSILQTEGIIVRHVTITSLKITAPPPPPLHANLLSAPLLCGSFLSLVSLHAF